MADATTYKCPQCGATLRPPNPVPAGKKIKCPKCQSIFAPTAEQPKAAAGKPAGAGKPKLDDEGGLYALKDDPPAAETPKRSIAPPDDEDDDAPKKKKKKPKEEESQLEKDLLAKQGPARKKGATQATCQAPSNKMLSTSSLTCASCVLSLVVALWPLVFTKERSWTTGFLGMDFYILALVPLLIGAFFYNGAIAIGAVKMQSVESYSWAMLGSMLTIIPASWGLAIPAYFWFYKLLGQILPGDVMFPMITMGVVSAWYVYVGMWNLKTLRDPEVIEGFAEKGPEYGD